jgi:ATP/maltotriose-dependent transcriptional regulator MalT
VLGWWDAVPRAAEVVGAPRVAVLERAAQAALWAGEPVRAEELVTAALAGAAGDGPGVRTAVLLELRAQSRTRAGRPGAVADLRAAITAADHGAIRPYLLTALAAQLMDVPDPPAARAAAEQALAEAGGSGDDPAAAGALVTLATLDARVGDLDEQLPRLARAGAIARAVGAHQLGLRVLDRESHLLLGFGRLADAERVARAGLAAAAGLGLARSAGGAHAVNLAAALVAAGRWDTAVESIEHALELVPPPRDHALLLVLHADIAAHRGRTGPAQQLLDDAEALGAGDTARAPALVLPRLRARILLDRGRAAEAAEVTAAALAGPLLSTVSRYSWPLLAVAAEAAAALGDPAAIAIVRDTAAAVPARTGPQHAAAASTAALLAGDQQAWSAAVAAWDRLGQPLELARAQHGLGAAVLAAGGDRGRAAAALSRAVELAAGLGAEPLRAAAADLARRARLPLGRGGGPPRPAGDLAQRLGLTPRESEVLRLVADGLANADIAARLFISTKTASVHVSNILGKLQVANRVEAAAAAHRLGLAGGSAQAATGSDAPG